MHRLGPRLLIGFLGVLLAVGLAPPTHAAAAPTGLSISGTPAYAGQNTTLRMELTDENGDPLAGKTVFVNRKVSGQWAPIGSAITDAEGTATFSAEMMRKPGRERLPGPVRSARPACPTRPSPAPVHVDLMPPQEQPHAWPDPGSVKDEKSVELRVLWVTGNGTARRRTGEALPPRRQDRAVEARPDAQHRRPGPRRGDRDARASTPGGGRRQCSQAWVQRRPQQRARDRQHPARHPGEAAEERAEAADQPARPSRTPSAAVPTRSSPGSRTGCGAR